MTRVPLKLVVHHGMSSHPDAVVVHEIDPERAQVVYWTNSKGEYRVQYRIRFYCGTQFKIPPRLFRNAPRGTYFCKACGIAKHDPLYWYKIERINQARAWKKSHGA